MEHEIIITRLFNDYLAGPAIAILNMVGVHAEHPDRPWTNYITMQILVALLIVVVFAILRPRLSMEHPGKLQHIFESIYYFIRDTASDSIEHHPGRFVPYFGTIFIFILFMNLIGIIPGLESPTMFPPVPLGLALATFFFYNVAGIQELGVVTYVKHFFGPMVWLAPLMFPIELISHMARPLSLTLRLYANMFAGEQVTLAFLGLVPLVIPAVFMGLHVFVAFLQAYIFTLLTMIYVGGAVAHEH
jgi:F-type H+-transporting ATPase subunit a